MIPLPLLLEMEKAVILPWCVHLVLQLVLQIKKCVPNTMHLHGKKKVEFSFDRFSTGLQYTFYMSVQLPLS
jgi:hypothetical protein